MARFRVALLHAAEACKIAAAREILWRNVHVGRAVKRL
jgi:hypothetical protein